MSTPLKLKSANCQQITFTSRLKKANFDVAKLQASLVAAYPRKKEVKRLPFFVPIEPANPETDSHLHLSVSRIADDESVELELELQTLSRPSQTKTNTPVTIENIGTWLGGSIEGELSGNVFASFYYTGKKFRPVIPLPYSGILPIESALIRKASIAGLDVQVDESDVGLRRFFLYKPSSDTIALSVIFDFTYGVNYALFGKVMEKALAISSVLVLKGKDETSVG
jgi:hypothetical protein